MEAIMTLVILFRERANVLKHLFSADVKSVVSESSIKPRLEIFQDYHVVVVHQDVSNDWAQAATNGQIARGVKEQLQEFSRGVVLYGSEQHL